MLQVASYNDGITPNWEMFLDQGRWWKVIWEQATHPDGTTTKRTRSVYYGQAVPDTPQHFYYMERFSPTSVHPT